MNRWKVKKISGPIVTCWLAMDGHVLAPFPTHAKAIDYATRRARLTCTHCGRRMPYLEACIDGLPYCHPEQGQDCYQEVRWPGIYMQDVINASRMFAAPPINRYAFTKPARDQQ